MYGLAFGMAVPAIYSAVAAKTDEASQNLGSTILLVAVNMGVFLSPYVFQLIASAFGDTSAVFSMRVDGLLVLALAVITLVTASLQKPERAPKPVHAK